MLTCIATSDCLNSTFHISKCIFHLHIIFIFPYSTLSGHDKILETVVVTRVTDHLERHHFLCSRQFGFRQKRSAADLQLLLASGLSAALDQSKVTFVVALDVEGAFDRVWHETLVTKLWAAGIDGALLPLLRDYLSDRHLKVTVSGQESEVQSIEAGVPQESSFSPLLWNIYINDLLHLIPSAKVYADDITLAQSYNRKEERAIVSQLNTRLSRIVAWGMWQIKFASHKTQLLRVSRSSTALRLNFNRATLKPQDEVEVLRFTYDRGWTFRTHIARPFSEASGKLASLRRMSWLLDDMGLETLYKAQVRSSMEFACLAWVNTSNKHLILLGRVQDRVARLITDNDAAPFNTVVTLWDSRWCIKCR